jgi:ubiquitin-conjugating enzyme E2 J2
MKDLPNMGEKEKGISDSPPKPTLPAAPVKVEGIAIPVFAAPPVAPSNWTTSIWKALHDKWRWGAFLAFAVLISRLSSK